MKIFITKHLFTKGIIERDVEPTQASSELVKYKGAHSSEYYYGEGLQWHRTREGAIERANKLRAAEIKKLQNRINKLNQMTFE